MTYYVVTLESLSDVLSRLGPRRTEISFPVAITGAGISLASGIPLLAEKVAGVSLQEFFRPQLLKEDPVRFYDAFRQILSEWRTAKPNRAHEALAARGVDVITQNIDGLHRDAGTANLIELHGNLRELVCTECDQIFHSHLAWESAVPRCPGCGAVLWPGISLEGAPIRHFSRAVDWVGRADLLFVIGTRLDMDPVRRLPRIADKRGVDVVWVNQHAERIVPVLLDTACSGNHGC
jgi:NAD-dependent deacetylase